jgi:GNAT superfamily N-acetyltransferase
VYDGDEQVGFARVVTDRATFAHLMDVFIVERRRGEGLGRRLIAAVMEHPDLQSLRIFSLATADAHELYERFGFRRVPGSERRMEL